MEENKKVIVEVSDEKKKQSKVGFIKRMIVELKSVLEKWKCVHFNENNQISAIAVQNTE